MTTCNLELKGLMCWFPSREGVRKQLRIGRGVLYAILSKYPFQKSNHNRFINTPLQPHYQPAPSREGNKNSIIDSHKVLI